LNGDGALDLVIANHETKHVSVLLGNGRGSFKAAPGSAVRVQSKPHVHGVALGDFDQDGNLDIAVESWEDDQIEVIRGDGKGGFTTPGRMFAAGRMPYYKLRAGDANKDGRADVFTTNMRGASITVLLGTGVGALSPAAGSPFS